jgi:hypothetical protein
MKDKPKYNAQRVRNMFDQSKPFKLSRSKLELFVKCQRCFYMDRRLGINQPPGFPFNLNSAVDHLLKKEFNLYRVQQKPHPLFIEHNLSFIPFQHEQLEPWRDSLHKGVQYAVPNTNIIVTGGLDDVWLDPETQELIVADYKATSKEGAVTLDADWQIQYKRQAEIYQWLLRKNGFKVSDTAYFVYCNGKRDAEQFNKTLMFDISLLPYCGNDTWVDEAVLQAYACLQSDELPPKNDNCELCKYLSVASNVINQNYKFFDQCYKVPQSESLFGRFVNSIKRLFKRKDNSRDKR